MTYLLDTHVVSSLRQRRPDNDRVLEWAATQTRVDLWLSVVSVMELEVGVLRIERRDPSQGERLRRWLDERVLSAFEGRVIPIDAEVASRAAALQVPDPAPVPDALIAATALVHDLVLVTRNVRDFEVAGLSVLDPWEVE